MLKRPCRKITAFFECRFLIGCLLILSACKSENTAPVPLFRLMDSTGIGFENTVIDSRSDNSFYFRNFYNGGGVAIGDINNDDLPDVLLTSNMGKNKLYLNTGQFKFRDISESSGLIQDSMWSTGVVMADVNADGWLDIYECNSGYLKKRVNRLYINDGKGAFSEQASKYGLDVSGYCTQASFFDYDLDGDLDCFLINNSPIPFSSLNYANMRDVDIENWKVSEDLKGGGNHLYRNDKGHFTEVTKEAGLHSGLISFGLGVSVGDINGDRYPDIYVGNDFIEKDYLYINQGNGSFRDDLEECVQKISMSSMSSDLGDINNDGHPEIFTTDMIPDDDYRLKTTGTFDNIDLYLSKQKAGLYHQYVKNCLQLNNGDGSFSEIAEFAGVSATDWSWGAVFLDADNDGWNDLFICNGINRDVGDLDFLDFFSNDVYQQMVETGRKKEMEEILKHIPVTPISNRVFRNNGNLRFSDIAQNWGLSQPSFSNSIAYGDLDKDGDLDLVINNENMPAFIYRNGAREQNGHHFLSILLKGKAPNTFAIGSKIKIIHEGKIFYREVVPSRGFQSAMDHRQVIGLGEIPVIDSVEITWPNGGRSILKDVKVDQHLTINEAENEIHPPVAPVTLQPFLVSVPVSLEPHREDEYVDFYYERNLPQMMSRMGPRATVHDVNNDGLDDVYIGGGKGQQGQLYFGSPTGFVKQNQKIFSEYADFEDNAVVFFDADGDSYVDLFIGAGGNTVQGGVRELQHRLYKNDGKGNFTIDIKAFPVNDMNISVAAPEDFDSDGDIDLFVGASSVPMMYGVSPRSAIFRNDGQGRFTDVTRELNPSLAFAGMIMDAVWADLLGDKSKELVVTGQWMETKIFTYRNKKFEEVTGTKLSGLSGWWQRIHASDLDKDGRVDLVIGNVGENFYLRPRQEEPVKLWIADFDGNGSTDQFLTRTVNGKDMPVFLKREITEQFPALKKGNLKHSEYAKKSIQDLFPGEILKKASVKTFNYGTSVIAMNRGEGDFELIPLPDRVQLSSVNAIETVDVNGDGQNDLLLGGNMFGFPPQFGRLDASYGHLLLNEGGKFTYQPSTVSGIKLKGEIREIKRLTPGKTKQVLFLQNNDRPVLYRITK